MSIEGPKRRVKASKKSKKSWRKNTDVEQVEQFLDDQRLEERLGGSWKQRKDEELFVEEVLPEAQVTKETEEDLSLNPRLATRQKRAAKKLKCYSHLEITSGVPDPLKKRNRVRSKEERQNPVVKKKEEERIKSGKKKAKEIISKKHRTETLKHKGRTESLKPERTTRRRTTFDFDLWDTTDSKLVAKDRTGSLKASKTDDSLREDEWINPKTKQHILKGEGKLKRKVPNDLLEKTSALPAVDVPHAGSSYNPSYADHQDLLWKAAMVEVGKDKEKHKIEYHTTKMYPSRENMPTEQDYLKEMSQGIGILEEEKEEDEESGNEEAEQKKGNEDCDDEEEEKSKEKEPDFKMKTRKQRRKEKLIEAMSNRRLRAKEEKKKNTEILRVKSLKKALEEEEARIAYNARKRRLKSDERYLTEPHKLSKHKFDEGEIDIKLSDELTGNLRSIKPEGNILQDRYRSFQKRNITETRVRHVNVKNPKKRKRLQKRSYKMPWEL